MPAPVHDPADEGERRRADVHGDDGEHGQAPGRLQEDVESPACVSARLGGSERPGRDGPVRRRTLPLPPDGVQQ